MNDTFKLELTVVITDEDIDDLMSNAMDSVGYWCKKAEVVDGYLGEYASEQISRGGTLRFYPIEPITNDAPKCYELTRKKLVNAIADFVNNTVDNGGILEWDSCGNARIDIGQVDGYDSDVIIQNALFGEVVFE